MEKEFSIEGCITMKEVSHDLFNDTFITFVELNKWFFGGGTTEIKEGYEYKIYGAINVEDELSYDQFYSKLITFFNSKNWAFNGEILEIIDGYYINEDGTRGKHIFEGTGYTIEESKSNKVVNIVIALGTVIMLSGFGLKIWNKKKEGEKLKRAEFISVMKMIEKR